VAHLLPSGFQVYDSERSHEVFILKQVMEKNLNATTIELAIVQPGESFHMFTKEELEGTFKE
jgi:hypothetical protein